MASTPEPRRTAATSSPELSGLAQHAERPLDGLALVVLDVDESGHQMSFCSERYSTIFSAAAALVLDALAVAARGRVGEGVHLGAGAGLARVVRVEAEVGERDRLLRLLLRAHDPLEGRVARLVDRVGDGDDDGSGASRTS